MRKLRKETIALKQRGISGTHISKLLKIPKSTVFDAIKRFEKLGDYSNRSGRGLFANVLKPISLLLNDH